MSESSPLLPWSRELRPVGRFSLSVGLSNSPVRLQEAPTSGSSSSGADTWYTFHHLLRSTGRLEMRSLGMPVRNRRTFALTPDGASTTSTSLALSSPGGRRGCTCSPTREHGNMAITECDQVGVLEIFRREATHTSARQAGAKATSGRPGLDSYAPSNWDSWRVQRASGQWSRASDKGVHRTSDVRKSLKDGCNDSPLSFFSSPPSHSGHRWVFLSNTHDLNSAVKSRRRRSIEQKYTWVVRGGWTGHIIGRPTQAQPLWHLRGNM